MLQCMLGTTGHETKEENPRESFSMKLHGTKKLWKGSYDKSGGSKKEAIGGGTQLLENWRKVGLHF